MTDATREIVLELFDAGLLDEVSGMVEQGMLTDDEAAQLYAETQDREEC